MSSSKEKIIKALNEDVALELAAIIQYANHHVMVNGIESPEISDLFEKISRDEMKHLELFMERVDYLGGVPTTKPGDIKTGGDIKKMVQDDFDAENGAAKKYKADIKLCIELDDPVTRLMLENITSQEEGHAYQWQTILGK